MPQSIRRILAFVFLACGFLAAGKSLWAYPVSITINATFSEIAGQPDPAGLGIAPDPSAIITAKVESSAPQGSYPASVLLTVPSLGLTNRPESGTLSISSSGQITASFADSVGSFSAVLVLAGVSFPVPVPTSFGTASFSAPASSVTYDLLGAQGKVGISGTASAVGLTVTPTTAISATYQVGGPTPATQSISIGSNDPGSPNLAYSVGIGPGSNGSSTGFLTLSSTGGTTPGTVTATFSTSVAPGTYTAAILINTTADSSGAPVSVPVTYVVTPPGATGGLVASPGSLTFNFTSGGSNPGAQTVAVSDTGSTPVTFTAASSVPWATVTPASGTTPANLTVNVNPAGITGTVSGVINVTGAGASLAIPITLVVTSSGGGGGSNLTVSPTNLNYQFFLPGTAVQTQTVSVGTSGPAVTYTASVTAGGSFLSVSPVSGSTPGSVSVTANLSSLPQGTYTGAITFSASGAPSVTVPVTAVYGQSHSVPITLSPSSLTFSYALGQPVPPPQKVTISSPTPVSFTLTSTTFYLPVSPSSGVTTATATVGLNPGAPVGTYQYAINVGSDFGIPVSLPVTVNVTAPGSPALSSSPAALVFTYPAASGSSLTQMIGISANTAAVFAASASVPWLTVAPTSGTIATGGSVVNLTVTANTSTLTKGTYTGNIVVTSSTAGISPLTIPVTFNVTQDPPPSVTFLPGAVAFAYQKGGTSPPPQTVAISATPAESTYTVSAFGASWLSFNLSADSKTATLSVNTSGLADGVYNGSIKVVQNIAGSAPQPVFLPVTLTVSDGPVLGVSPTTLTFNYQPNGTAPASQVVAVATSSASPVVTAIASDSPWLSVTPTAGSAPGTLTVSVIPGNMGNGTYHGKITVSGGGTSSTVPVTLNINANAIPVLSAVTNGISYATQTGAPGLIVSLWGQGLGPATPAPLELATPGTVSTSAGGTQVFADGIPCPILFAYANQVNAILPFSLDGKTSTQISVSYLGVTSNTLTLPVEPASPAVFSTNATGTGGGAILNQDLSLNTAANPAPAGSIVVLYGGGGGQTNPQGSDGLIVPIVPPFPAPVLPGAVTIGNQPAQILYYGDAPGLVSGVLQINAVVPAGLAPGPQPVVVTIGNIVSPSTVVVYVR